MSTMAERELQKDEERFVAGFLVMALGFLLIIITAVLLGAMMLFLGYNKRIHQVLAIGFIIGVLLIPAGLAVLSDG